MHALCIVLHYNQLFSGGSPMDLEYAPQKYTGKKQSDDTKRPCQPAAIVVPATKIITMPVPGCSPNVGSSPQPRMM